MSTTLAPPPVRPTRAVPSPARRRTVRLDRWRRPLRWLLVAALAAAGTLVAVEVGTGGTGYPVTAVFARAPGLFPGATVELLGVEVGRVTSVQTAGARVVVGMRVAPATPLPARTKAALESPELLGEPDIDLSPGYTGGPALASGATIPESRTSEPISTEQLLEDLDRTLNRLNPKAVRNLVTNLAEDLQGQGQALNKLISGAAGTMVLLADKGNELGQLNGTLAQLTGTLDSRTSQIQTLVNDYDTVSGVVASHSAQLSGAISSLTTVSGQLVNLLAPNLSGIESDISTVTTAGRTLDRNTASVDETLQQAVLLFAAAHRAYDPGYNWINLNLQTPLGVTGAYVAGLVRDRLAGVCRRILANHSAGLTPAQIATLGQCGNPNSGYFDPIISDIPTALNDLSSGTPPTTPLSQLQAGLAEIPGLSPAAPSTPSAPAAAAPSTPTSTTTTTTQPPTSSGSSSGSGSILGSGSGTKTCILNGLLGCLGSSSGSGSTPPTTSSKSGTSGLLAYDTKLPSRPSATGGLGATAARLLPPMPSERTLGGESRPHPGFLDHVGHAVSDLWSWL